MSRVIDEEPIDLAASADDGRDRRFDVDPPAVLAHAHDLDRLHHLAAAHAVVHVLEHAALGRHEELDRVAEHLLGAVAEHALGRRVPARDLAAARAADDRLEGGVDDGLALAQRRLARFCSLMSRR